MAAISYSFLPRARRGANSSIRPRCPDGTACKMGISWVRHSLIWPQVGVGASWSKRLSSVGKLVVEGTAASRDWLARVPFWIGLRAERVIVVSIFLLPTFSFASRTHQIDRRRAIEAYWSVAAKV
jgi:hypothetical protein